jgi:hypothetical protein
MLLDVGLCGAWRAHAAAGAAAWVRSRVGMSLVVLVLVQVACIGVCAVVVCTGRVSARPLRGLYCRVSAGRSGSGWASGEEEAGWVGACLPDVGGRHWGARCYYEGGM